MDSREEILANFQACTGIDDVGDAISQLEEAGWVLVTAVNTALANSSASAAPAAAPAPPAADIAPPAAAAPSGTAENAAAAAAAALDGFDIASLPPPLPTRRSPSPPINVESDDVGPSLGGVSLGPSPHSMLRAAGGFSGFGNSGSVTIANDLFGAGSSSGGRTRMLEFYITHLERTFNLKVPDNEDVKTLKSLIQGETGFPPCQQSLHGLGRNGALPGQFISDRRRLSELNLPKENFIHLLTPELPNGTDDTNAEQKPEEPGDFKLIVTDQSNPAKKTYNLNFRPTHTVLNVKLDVSTLTSIPVSKQVWTGWPDGANEAGPTDELSLAQLGIESRLELTLDRKSNNGSNSNGEPQAGGSRDMPIVLDDVPVPSTSSAAATSSSSSNNAAVASTSKRKENDINMDSDDDDFEDASSEVMLLEEDDDWMIGTSKGGKGSAIGRRLQPLIPDDYGDETMAGIKFSEEFANRYGRPHPTFFPGSLDDAIAESCMKSPKERKMLAVYLHHDSSVLTNVFCAQALCAESVVSFLNENFVTFGWDLSFSSNKKRLLAMVTNHFGSVAAATIRNFDIEKLPLVALVYRLRGTTEIFQIVHGNVTLDELMSQLLQAHETYTAQLAVDIEEERAREARNAVKMEQDLAFAEAQQADREREEKKQREEEERKEQERVEEAIRRSEEEAASAAAAEKEQHRLSVLARLPEEPEKDVKHARIRFRAGGADSEPRTFERRFLPTDPLQVVLDFLVVEGFNMKEHKLLSSWPRRDLTTLDPTDTMEKLKLFPQETLIVEER